MPRSSAGTDTFPDTGIPGGAAHGLREAQAFCARLARRHYENFPVASWIVPSRIRPAVQAIYAFARMADDFADEATHEGRRIERLDEWRAMLEECFKGLAIHPVFVALREAIARHALPRQPFVDLLTAFRLDVTCRRYPDEPALLEYCRLSANPVGRLMLHLSGHRDPALLGPSDALCTALQLANHWQDVAIDMRKDRIYLPEDARRRFGVVEDDLRLARGTDAFRALMRDQVGRARSRFDAGRPLCDAVRGRFRWEMRLTWLGGRRILERIEGAAYDVLSERPKLGARDAVLLAGRAIAWGS